MPVPAHNGGAQTCCNPKEIAHPPQSAADSSSRKLRQAKKVGNTVGSPSDPVTTETKWFDKLTMRSRLSRTLRGQHAGNSLKEMLSLDWQSYLSGFVDGEGCFCVTFNKSKRHRFGWDVRPSFSASQNQDRAQALFKMKDHFGCGNIRPDRSDRTIKYEVRSVPELVQKIIPHFQSYPMLSSKQADFERFAQIVFRINEKQHLTENSFREIANLAQGLNIFGKKRYLRTDLKYSLCPTTSWEST